MHPLAAGLGNGLRSLWADATLIHYRIWHLIGGKALKWTEQAELVHTHVPPLPDRVNPE